MNGNMIALAVVAGIAALVGLAYLHFRPKKTVPTSPLRSLLNAYFSALRSERAEWNSREELGSPPENFDKETGLFCFLAPDGSLNARYEAMGTTSRLHIVHSEHHARIDYVGGSVSSVTLDNAVLEETHAELRQNATFMRKLRAHTRSLIGFYVAPEELEEAPKEFAKPTGRTLNYGRDEKTTKKKRPKRTRQTDE